MAGQLLETEEALAKVVRAARTIAVVGMKDGSSDEYQPAFSVPRGLAEKGYQIVPVNPTIQAALGHPAYPDIASVPERFDPIDVVDVFRRSDHIPDLVDQILALPAKRRPRLVWLQSGIRHDAAAARLTAAGIDVVQDRCLGVYVSRYLRPGV